MENSILIVEAASKGYLTLRKAAPLLGLSYPTILKYRDKEWIKTMQFGGQFRIYEDEILYLMTNGIQKKHYSEREGKDGEQ